MEKGGMETYSAESNDLARELATNILGDAVEVEHKLRESLSVMSLPLSNSIHGIRGSLFCLDSLHQRLTFLFASCNELLLERTRCGIVGTSRK